MLEAGFRQLVGKLPTASGADIEASTRLMMKDLNRMGLTAFGSAGCEADVLPTFRKLADQGQLNVRVGCITSPAGGGNTDQLLPRIAQMKLFQGDAYLDSIFYGESVFGPLHDPMFIPKSDPKPDQLATWRRIATEIAKAHLPLHVHANLTNTLDAFLDQIEQINKEYPIKNLRWTLAHVNQLNASHLERMKKLGMYAAVHPWAVINGGINQAVFGDAALDMAQLSTIQNSGIMWGFGSDGSRANQIQPFTTLWWAVTGKMVGGTRALRESNTISREDALIAHTRRNAFFLFQEDNLGSIQPGKLADLVVLDRDYLTVPVDQIKDIKSVMTIVGGRVVYDASEPVGVAASAPNPIGDHEHDEENECDPDRVCALTTAQAFAQAPATLAKVTVSGEVAKRTLTKTQINADTARALVDACLEFGKASNATYSVFVLAPNGDIVAAQVMDGVLPIGVETGPLKAKTALYARTPSSAVAQRFNTIDGRLIRLDLGKESRALPTTSSAAVCPIVVAGPADRRDRRRRREHGRAVRLSGADEGARAPAAVAAAAAPPAGGAAPAAGPRPRTRTAITRSTIGSK